MKKINPNPKKALSLNKMTVSMFTQTSANSNNGAKNQGKFGSLVCLPTTSTPVM